MSMPGATPLVAGHSGHLAIGWIGLHVLLFSLSAVIARLISAEVKIEHQLLSRAAFAVLFIVATTKGAVLASFKSTHWPLLLLRGVLGFVGIYGTFYSFTVIPISIAMMIVGATPLLVMVFAAVLLKERFSAELVLYALMAAASVFFVTNTRSPLDTAVSAQGVLIALGSSISTAFAFLTVRSLANRVGTQTIVFWFGLCCLAGFLAVGGPPVALTDSSMSSKVLLGMLCIFGVGSDLTKTKAYQYGEAWFISLLAISSIAVSGLLAWMILGEVTTRTQLLWIALMMLTLALATFRCRPDAKRLRSSGR